MQTAFFTSLGILAIATPVALIMPPLWSLIFGLHPVLQAFATCTIVGVVAIALKQGIAIS